MFTTKTSLIIPTRNRSNQIITLLNQLIQLNLKFNEVIVIDSSNLIHSKKVKNECRKNFFYYYLTVKILPNQDAGIKSGVLKNLLQ